MAVAVLDTEAVGPPPCIAGPFFHGRPTLVPGVGPRTGRLAAPRLARLDEIRTPRPPDAHAATVVPFRPVRKPSPDGLAPPVGPGGLPGDIRGVVARPGTLGPPRPAPATLRLVPENIPARRIVTRLLPGVFGQVQEAVVVGAPVPVADRHSLVAAPLVASRVPPLGRVLVGHVRPLEAGVVRQAGPGLVVTAPDVRPVPQDAMVQVMAVGPVGRPGRPEETPDGGAAGEGLPCVGLVRLEGPAVRPVGTPVATPTGAVATEPTPTPVVDATGAAVACNVGGLAGVAGAVFPPALDRQDTRAPLFRPRPRRGGLGVVAGHMGPGETKVGTRVAPPLFRPVTAGQGLVHDKDFLL